MPLVLVSSRRFVDHVTPVGHPERPERAEVLSAVAATFRQQGGEVVEPRLATDQDLLRVHTREHVDAIVATRGKATMSTRTRSPRRIQTRLPASPPGLC